MKVVKAILLIGFLALVLLGGYCAWAWNDLNTPHEHLMAGKTVNIPTGSSSEQIVQKLQSDGIISDPTMLKLYIKLQGVGSLIKAGDYVFPSPISPKDVVHKLLEGGAAGDKLTIIEGWTRFDVAHAMASIRALHLRNSDQALALMNNTSSVRDLDPTASSLEGYMFPDTYFVQSTTTPKELLESSVEHFHQVWNKELAPLAAASRQSAHDIVTIASIIETEAKLPEERPIVASVIYNRLRQRIPLSVDSTIVYASKLAGKWHNNGIVYLSDVNRESPYNTRKVVGLPPGPVSNPGLSSLKAALQPAHTNYIYYVREPSRDDGAHNFYADAAGFEVGVQALRNWERTHRGHTSANRNSVKTPSAETVTSTKSTSTTQTTSTTTKRASTTQTTSATTKRASTTQTTSATTKRASTTVGLKNTHASTPKSSAKARPVSKSKLKISAPKRVTNKVQTRSRRHR